MCSGKILVVLRDGRTLIGTLRSIDQFGSCGSFEWSGSDLSSPVFPANLVLHRTIERIHVGRQFGDIPRGIFLIRGENVVLLGEVVRSGMARCPLALIRLVRRTHRRSPLSVWSRWVSKKYWNASEWRARASASWPRPGTRPWRSVVSCPSPMWCRRNFRFWFSRFCLRTYPRTCIYVINFLCILLGSWVWWIPTSVAVCSVIHQSCNLETRWKR